MVEEDGRQVREWLVRCAGGRDDRYVMLDDSGVEVEIEWSEVEANGWFEEDFASFVEGWQRNYWIAKYLSEGLDYAAASERVREDVQAGRV
jgi:hypothetical protein